MSGDTPKATKAKLRAAAYRIVARTALGRPLPEWVTPEVFEGAVCMILDDDRKTRTRAERAAQLHLRATLTVLSVVHLAESGGLLESAQKLNDTMSEAISTALGKRDE